MLEAVTRGRREAPIYRSCHRRNSGPQPTLLLKWEPVNSSRSGASPAGSTGEFHGQDSGATSTMSSSITGRTFTWGSLVW